VISLGALGILLGAGGAGFFYVTFVRDLPDLTSVADYEPALTSHVYDRNGRPIGSFFKERRQITPYEEIPEQVVQAFIAAEDASYFEHEGIDFKAILRAAWSNFSGEGGTQGASTITQQTVKTLLLSPERTYTRKIREAILARRLEQHFTKQEILFLYLNQIYFGHGAYGIGAAARSYFDKEVQELDVGEIAMLAGLPKAPSKFSPFRDAERAETRRQYVLRRMREESFIDTTTFDTAMATPPVLASAPPNSEDFAAAAYFTEGVRRYLFESLGGERVLTGGLRIETTLDIDKQRSAVTALRQGVEDLDRRQGYRGHVREVGKAGLEAAIAGLPEENGLENPSDEASAEAEPLAAAEAAPEGEDIDLLALVEEKLAEPTPLLGVVTSVDRAAKLAHVALAPGVRGVTHLEDVSWARPADPEVRGNPLKKIRSVFSVGDVAWFQSADSHPMDEEAAQARARAEEARAEEAGEGGEAPTPAPALHLTLYQKPAAQAGLLSLDVDKAEVLALVGGYDFEQSEFDRVTQARRQPGSAFKPMIFGAALSKRSEDDMHDWTPASIVYASAQIYEDKSTGFIWKPKNYSRKFLGPVTLRYALAKSINTAAIQLADEVGVGDVIDYARRLGIESPLEHSLALALGSNEVTLLELTRAYAVFPARGRRVEPTFIRRVLDRDGNVLLENIVIGSEPVVVPPPGEEPAVEATSEPETPSIEIAAVVEDPGVEEFDSEEFDGELEEGAKEPVDPNQLIPQEDAFLMADMLRAVVQEGTGYRLKALGRPLGGKTGTTNDQADGWFVGFSPGIATGVWVGHDSSQKLGVGETGSRAAAPIWVDYMRVALDGRPVRDFEVPGSIVYTRIDRKTGLLASATSGETLFQAFVTGSEPTTQAAAQQTTDDAMRNLREEAFSGDSSMRLMQLDTF
jgi:penicillin-binding protein 1A